MTDHRTAALDAFAAAEAIPGEPTRTELLLKALFHATLAPKAPAAEPLTRTAPITHAEAPTRAELLLSVIRREGGIWDAKRAGAAYLVAGGELPPARDATTWARIELTRLADAGYLAKTGIRYSLPSTADSP